VGCNGGKIEVFLYCLTLARQERRDVKDRTKGDTWVRKPRYPQLVRMVNKCVNRQEEEIPNLRRN